MSNHKKSEESAHREQYEKLSDLDLLKVSRQFSYHDVRSYMAQQILNEREESALAAKEKREVARHDEIQKKIEELKVPHRPSFWLLVITVILALVAAISGILALPQVQKAAFEKTQFQAKKEQLQSSENR